MIWDYIRDFFVQYIFGGYTSNEVGYGGVIGQDYTTALDIGFNFGESDSSGNFSAQLLTLGDWLSTTATIICMVLISICFILLVRWIFKAVASAFLLK